MEDNHVDVIDNKNKSVESIFTLFSNLTGERNQNPKFCLDLIKNLRESNFNVGSGNNLNYSVKRLIRGIGSTRLYTQCGCFASLTCILKYQACSVKNVLEVLEKEQFPEKGATKAELKALCISCVLTCGAIIHSGQLATQPFETQQTIINKLVEAGKKKSYLTSVVFRFLDDIINLVDNHQFKDILWPLFTSKLLNNLDHYSSDTFNLLLVCFKKNNKIVSKFLEKNSSSIEATIEKIINFLFNNSVKYNHPLYENVCQVFCSNSKLSIKFWEKCVKENGNVSSHKDSVIIILFSHIIKSLKDISIIPKLLIPKLIEVIIKVLSFKKVKNEKTDDSSAVKIKSSLNLMTSILCTENVSDEIKFETIKKLMFYPSNMKFEMKTGTKCIHTLASNLKEEFTKKLLEIYKNIINGQLRKIIDDNGNEEIWNTREKQQALHIFTKILNHPSLKNESNWKLEQIKFIFDVAFLKKFTLTADVQKCAKDCFYKAIMVQTPSLKELVNLLNNLAWYVNENIEYVNLKASEDISLWEKTYKSVQSLQKKSKDKIFISVHVLLIYMGLHLFSDGQLAKVGIEDLLSCYEKLKKIHQVKKEEDDCPNWTEVTVDLLLSLLSRENKLWRHVVACIFPQVVAHMTPTALHQIIHALDPSSSNNILSHIDSDSESEEEEKGETGEESESSVSESTGEDYEEDEGNVNEQLRMAVRNALGYSAAQTDDESADMDEMDEEEEKRLNDNLAEAFRQFKIKSPGKKKKQTKEEEALTHFRLRVLDLVEVYINNSPTMAGCLDLMIPLLDILELSIKDHHQRPLQSRTDSILKHLAAVKTFSDSTDVTQAGIKNLFDSVISRKEISALIFVEMSPRVSDCTKFLVRCSQLIPHKNSEVPLMNEYDTLLKSYFQSRDFKLPISMFQTVLRIAWKGNFKLVETLLEFLAASNVRIFKKTKIIELLRTFYKNEQLHASCDEVLKANLNRIETNFIKNFSNTISEFENNENKSTGKMYLSFLSNLINLINLILTRIKRHRQETNLSQWKNLILKFSQVEIINENKKTKTQLANIANTLNISLSVKKTPKRRRTVSESSISTKEAGEEPEEEDKVEEQPKKKKSKKKMSAEKIKLKKQSRELREKFSSNGLEEIKFSLMDSSALPEPELEEQNAKKFKKRKKVNNFSNEG